MNAAFAHPNIRAVLSVVGGEDQITVIPHLDPTAGPYGFCHTDPDGNEVDLVPGEAPGEEIGTADWQSVFSAMACFRTTSPTQQRDLADAAAALADDTGFALLVDLRLGLVIIDSGEDQWEDDACAASANAWRAVRGARGNPLLARHEHDHPCATHLSCRCFSTGGVTGGVTRCVRSSQSDFDWNCHRVSQLPVVHRTPVVVFDTDRTCLPDFSVGDPLRDVGTLRRGWLQLWPRQ